MCSTCSAGDPLSLERLDKASVDENDAFDACGEAASSVLCSINATTRVITSGATHPSHRNTVEGCISFNSPERRERLSLSMNSYMINSREKRSAREFRLRGRRIARPVERAASETHAAKQAREVRSAIRGDESIVRACQLSLWGGLAVLIARAR